MRTLIMASFLIAFGALSAMAQREATGETLRLPDEARGAEAKPPAEAITHDRRRADDAGD